MVRLKYKVIECLEIFAEVLVSPCVSSCIFGSIGISPHVSDQRKVSAHPACMRRWMWKSAPQVIPWAKQKPRKYFQRIPSNLWEIYRQSTLVKRNNVQKPHITMRFESSWPLYCAYLITSREEDGRAVYSWSGTRNNSANPSRQTDQDMSRKNKNINGCPTVRHQLWKPRSHKPNHRVP